LHIGCLTIECIGLIDMSRTAAVRT
jgi:hypothetical protein